MLAGLGLADRVGVMAAVRAWLVKTVPPRVPSLRFARPGRGWAPALSLSLA